MLIKFFSYGGYNLAINNKNELYAWSNNENNYIGDGTTDTKSRIEPTKILDNVYKVSANDYGNCAITFDGKLYKWNNIYGGYESETMLEPTCVMSGVKDALYRDSSKGFYAVLNNGNLVTWGEQINVNRVLTDVSINNPRVIDKNVQKIYESSDYKILILYRNETIKRYDEFEEEMIPGFVAKSTLTGNDIIKKSIYTLNQNDVVIAKNDVFTYRNQYYASYEALKKIDIHCKKTGIKGVYKVSYQDKKGEIEFPDIIYVDKKFYLSLKALTEYGLKYQVDKEKKIVTILSE